MDHRTPLLAVVGSAAALLASSSSALEKRAALVPDEGSWHVGGECALGYFNTCTGWMWVWSGWGPGDRLGTVFENCCYTRPFTPGAAWIYVPRTAPAGYGFTGTISFATATPEGCPDLVLESKPFLPAPGWNEFEWYTSLADGGLALVVTLGDAAGTPLEFATDLPAAGPTGPPASGTCYPSTRANHTWYWGTASSPLCPGSPLDDAVGDAQLVWAASFWCSLEPPHSLENRSWGGIKTLYR